MLKKMKNLNKQTKLAITVALVFIVVIGGTGAILYAQEQEQKQVILQQVQELNSAIKLPVNAEYNESELAEYNQLVSKQEQAFNDNDVETLMSLQSLFNELDNKVHQRLQKEVEERKAKEEQEIKEKAEAEKQKQEQRAHNDANNWDNNSWHGNSDSVSNRENSGNRGGSTGGGSSWQDPFEDGCTELGNCSTGGGSIGGNW